jgi:tetratricopeptide (TPR) repeat protein
MRRAPDSTIPSRVGRLASSPLAAGGVGLLAFALAMGGCGTKDARSSDAAPIAPQSSPAPATERTPAVAMADSGRSMLLSVSRQELLGYGNAAAMSIPVDPHGNDRSRSQERVVRAALAVDEVDVAERIAKSIPNWRRGMAMADVASRRIRDGELDAARRAIEDAKLVAAQNIEWRKVFVEGAIARVQLELDHATGAVPIGSAEDRTVEAQLADLTPITAKGNFDEVRGALEACVDLYREHYANGERRSLIESTVTSSWTRLPIVVRVELLERMTRIAIEHRDADRAKALLDQAKAMVDAAEWVPEEHVPTLARLAALRADAGDMTAARSEADAARETYRKRRDEMLNFDRADALAPLAAAYQRMGDAPAALDLFRLAIEEGAENPNARPRAMDLAATCATMAEAGFEPDEALKARIRTILGGLVAPW